MRLPSSERSTEWMKRLPSVVAALNGEVTRLTGKKPSEAKTLTQKLSSDPVWSLEVYRLGLSVTKSDEPVLYDLQGKDATQRGFVREELLVVLSDTQLPADEVLRR